MKTIINRLKEHLTDRQIQVVLAKHAHQNVDAAGQALGISPDAVKQMLIRVRGICDQVGLRTEIELLAGSRPAGPDKIAVFELISQFPSRTFSKQDVARLSGVRPDAASWALKSLSDLGHIERLGYDEYRARQPNYWRYWLSRPWRAA